MAKPLRATKDVFIREDRISKVEFLPIPNVLADYMLNLNTEVLRTAVEDMWDSVVGLLRLEGLKKTYRPNTDGTPATGKLNVLHPGSIADGETFTLYGVVFEYDKNSSVIGGHVAIDIAAAASVEDVRVATETGITGSSAGVTATPTRRSSPAAGSVGIGGEIDLINNTAAPSIAAAAAQIVTITDTVRDERFTHIGMRSSNPIYATGQLVVPAPTAFVDGETITIPGNGHPDAVLELDNNSSVLAGHVLVDLTGITTDAQIRDRLVTAINTKTSDTSVTAAALNLPARGYLTALDPALLADGATFTIPDGTTTKIFEIDKDSNWDPAHLRVDLSSAADMQDARAVIIAAINGATGLDIVASNPGFGTRIDLTNSRNNGSLGNLPVTHTVSDAGFLVGDMAGGAAAITLTTTVSGTTMNRSISDTVTSDLFTAEGMAGGIGAGWDVTPGHCAFRGFDVVLDSILRCPAVAGKQNFLRVRLRERLLDADSDPDITAVSGPGVVTPKPGPNQYRWLPSVVIEAADAAAPALVGQETRIIDAELAEFDATTGQTLVDEVEVRGTKFGRFLEPQDVTLKVSKVGDTMTGPLTLAATDPLTHRIVSPTRTASAIFTSHFRSILDGSVTGMHFYTTPSAAMVWTINAQMNSGGLWAAEHAGVAIKLVLSRATGELRLRLQLKTTTTTPWADSAWDSPDLFNVDESGVTNIPTAEIGTADILLAGISKLISAGRIQGLQGSDVTSGGTITLGDGNSFKVTGTNTINYLTTTDWQAGSVVTLFFAGALQVTHNAGSVPASTAPFVLKGATNFTTGANDSLTLLFRGTDWLEQTRSVNH